MPGLGKASSQATSKAPGEASVSQQKDHLQADGKVKYGDYSVREHVSPPPTFRYYSPEWLPV